MPRFHEIWVQRLHVECDIPRVDDSAFDLILNLPENIADRPDSTANDGYIERSGLLLSGRGHNALYDIRTSLSHVRILPPRRVPLNCGFQLDESPDNRVGG